MQFVLFNNVLKYLYIIFKKTKELMYENLYLLKVDVIEERKSTHSRYEESRFVKSLKYYVKSSKCLYIRDNIQRFQHNYTHCRRCLFFFFEDLVCQT